MVWIVFLVLTAFLVIHLNVANLKTISSPSHSSTSTGATKQARVVPLTDEQRQKVENTILASDFFKDIPEKDPVSIRFFYFEGGQRVWQDTFYMAGGELLPSAQATIKLTLHSKYIDELNGDNLCSIIQTANKNRDLGFESPYSDSKLIWKYKSMIKYRDCFGF